MTGVGIIKYGDVYLIQMKLNGNWCIFLEDFVLSHPRRAGIEAAWLQVQGSKYPQLVGNDLLEAAQEYFNENPDCL